MIYRLGAEFVLLTHFSFVVFVVVGGFVALRWPKLIYVHVPAAVWGAWIEFAGWICPLTPLENSLRRMAGDAGYEGGFIEHYLLGVLYPRGLTTQVQVILGIIVIAANILAYGLYWKRHHQQSNAEPKADATE